LGADFGKADKLSFGRMFGLETAVLAKVQMKMPAADTAFAQTIGDLFRHFPGLLWKNLDETQALGPGVLGSQVLRGGESAGNENRFLADLESPAPQSPVLPAMAEFVFVGLNPHCLFPPFRASSLALKGSQE